MRYLNTTWHHIRRSPYQTLAAIFIITQTFFVATIFTFVIFGSARVIDYFESQPQINAFFKDEAKKEQIEKLQDQLKETGKISKTKFVSKQEALKIYRRIFKDDPLLLELVTADILPASLEIATTKIDDLASISEILKNSTIVKEVIFPKDIITKLTTWTQALRKIGIALIAVLGLDSIFIMIIILGVRISQRKEEIEIIRLLGATNWYVRLPFIFEGAFYGLVGAFFGWATAVLALLYFTPYLQSFLGAIPVFPVSGLFLLEILAVEFLFAVLLGICSSFVAVFRYLK